MNTHNNQTADRDAPATFTVRPLAPEEIALAAGGVSYPRYGDIKGNVVGSAVLIGLLLPAIQGG